MERSITVGGMRKLIMESQGQFNPVMGNGVESENKKNNEKNHKHMDTGNRFSWSDGTGEENGGSGIFDQLS